MYSSLSSSISNHYSFCNNT